MQAASVIGIGKFPLFDISCNHFFIKNINLVNLANEVLIDGDPEKRLSNNRDMQGAGYEDTVFLGGEETKQLKDCINLIADSFNMVVSGEIWAHIHRPYESTNLHNHGGGDKSFVFYVKVPDGAGALYFELDPLGVSVIQPIEGLLVVFPACIKHGVYKNLSNDIRISISGNFKNK